MAYGVEQHRCCCGIVELKTSFGVRDNVAYDDYNVDNELGQIAYARGVRHH